MFDAEHGVAVVGVSPSGNGDGSPTLWISSDMTSWRDVTPPAAREPTGPGLYATFDQASFLNAKTGWVTTWNAGNNAVTAYRTGDGGTTWSAIGLGGHGDHAGDADWIQLVSPQVAFSEGIAATAPDMSLALTTDGGQSWHTSYDGPSPGSLYPSPGPFELPTSFVSTTRGFAATAIPPSEPQMLGGLFGTSDAGAHWTQRDLPGIDTAACSSPSTTRGQCLSTLPTFTDPTHAVVASEVIAETKASIRFDISSDAGDTWGQASATVDIRLPEVAADSYPKPYALIATPSTSNWWVVSDTAGGLTSLVTTDAGNHWSTRETPGVLGAPGRLTAIDATTAFVETEIITSDGGTGALFVTSDAGHSWRRVF